MIDPMIFEPFPVNVFIVTLRHTHTVYIKGVGTSMESATTYLVLTISVLLILAHMEES